MIYSLEIRLIPLNTSLAEWQNWPEINFVTSKESPSHCLS